MIEKAYKHGGMERPSLWTSVAGGPLEIVLYSVDGREVWREEVREEGYHESSLRLNVPLREGVYMLRVELGSMKREWTKVVVWQK